MNEIMKAQLLMQLILEDFDMDEETMRINQVFLNEDESPIDIISDLDKDKEVKKESDKESDEVTDLLGIDKLADRLEENPEELEDIKDKKIKLTIDNEEPKLKLQLSDLDDIDDLDADNIEQVILKLKSSNNQSNNDSDINLKLKSNDKNDIEVKLDDVDSNTLIPSSDIQVKINDNNPEDTINLKLKSNDSIDSDTIKVKLKSDEDFNDDNADVKIKLTNTDDNSQETKESLFIKKRDELIQSDDPNMQLSVILKIIVDLKKSLDRLINFIPDEIILVKTKYLLGDLLNEILESSDLLLKDKEKLKDNIYKIFDLVISINDYISRKYADLEDKIDQDTKESEDKQITQSLDNTEENIEDKQNNDEQDNNVIKSPNINRKKI